MSSPFDYSQNDLQPGTVGPRSTFFEQVEAGFDITFDEIKSVQDVRLADEYTTLESQLVDMGMNRQQFRIRQLPAFGIFQQDEESLPLDRDAIWESVQEIRQRNPQAFTDLPETQQEFERNVLRRQDQRGRDQEVLERGGSIVAPFIGGIGAAVTDPVNIVTLPFGGFGRSVAARLLTEGLVNAAVETAQTPDLIRSRERLGEETGVGDVLFNVAAAGIGAAAFRGVFEGGSLLRERFRGEQNDIGFDFTDEQMSQMFRAADYSPTARAGEVILNDVRRFDEANPFGAGRLAEDRFVAELSQVQRLMAGAAETTLARTMPPLPAEFIEKSADFEIVRKQSPEIYSRLEEAQAAVRALDERATEIRRTLDEATIPDAVRLVDEEAADALDELSVVVNDVRQPEPIRAAADVAAQAIINRVGPEKIAKALNDVEIAPRRELKDIRAKRRAANKRLRLATRAVEAERTKLQTAADKIRNTLQGEAVDLLGNAMTGRAFVGNTLTYRAVQDTVQRIDKIDEAAPDVAAKLTAGERADDGTYDIGLPARVTGDFTVPIEQADGSIRDMTVRQVFEEFKKDAALEEAVRSCVV